MPAADVIQDLSLILLVAGASGWICQRLGLPLAFGYLLGGIVAGPAQPSFAWVTNMARIQILWEIGVVFVMFSLGLRLNLRRLKQVGFSPVFAVLLAAPIVFSLARLAGALAGLPASACVVLASVILVSSSTVVARVLEGTGQTHERTGQLALGVSILEGVLAVLTLTLLGSFAPSQGGIATSFGREVGDFWAFVVLSGVVGLLLVSRLLRRLNVAAGEELQVVGVAALVFGLAIIARTAGFSLALGAFVLGAVVAGTPHRTQVERTFDGIRGVFTAVFFVTVGLQADTAVLGGSWWVVGGIAVFTLVVRSAAVALGLSLTGVAPKTALGAGAAVAPIGEFSFIIVQAAVAAGFVSSKWFSIVVGVSLVTILFAPVLTRRSGQVAAAVLGRVPAVLRQWHVHYAGWLERLRARQKRNRLWLLSRTRVAQVVVEGLFVTGLLAFSDYLYGVVEAWLGHDWLFPHGPAVLFLVTLTLVVMVPMVAIWRNVSALCLIVAQEAVRGSPAAARFAPVVERVCKALAAGGIYVWISTVLPIVSGVRWAVLAIALLAAVLLVLLRRRLIYWHSELEVGLQHAWQSEGDAGAEASVPWLRPQDEWKVTVVECVIPDLASCRGRTIGELALRERFGCSVSGIERQGYAITLPKPDVVLFPRDRVLLLGAVDKVAAGRVFLEQVSTEATGIVDFDDVSMETLVVPLGSAVAGRNLRQLAPLQRCGVQIAGVRRGSEQLLNPSGEEVLCAGDVLLVLGTPAGIGDFRDLLEDESGTAGSDGIVL